MGLTVGVVTKPFAFEGKRRRRFADQGIERLKDSVDTLLTIPNQRLLQSASPDLSMVDAFKMADNVLVNAVTGIIINITAGSNVSLLEVNEACMVIQDAAHEDANIIFGAVINEEIGDEIRVTVIATGFPNDNEVFETENLMHQRQQQSYQSHTHYSNNHKSICKPLAPANNQVRNNYNAQKAQV